MSISAAPHLETGRLITGRMRHYGTFYELPAERSSKPDRRPLALIHGNCQAESLRVLLAASEQLGVRTVRIPPVFEMTAADIPFLRRLAGNSQILLSQPVADDYHDLPLGTDQVAAMMKSSGAVIRWPVVQFAGFHPYQVTIRDPDDPGNDPPVVPYHDLRTLVSARTGVDMLTGHASTAACRQLADESRAELQRRERAGCDISISDVFDSAAPGDMATINHPGNRVLIELARRVQDALGFPPDAADPGRVLLGEIITPVQRPALRAMKVPGAGRMSWSVGGRRVLRSTVHRAQWQWYLEHPAVIAGGYRRHRSTLEMLGLV